MTWAAGDRATTGKDQLPGLRLPWVRGTNGLAARLDLLLAAQLALATRGCGVTTSGRRHGDLVWRGDPQALEDVGAAEAVVGPCA